MGVGGQRHAPAAIPPEKTLHLLYRRLGGWHQELQGITSCYNAHSLSEVMSLKGATWEPTTAEWPLRTLISTASEQNAGSPWL